MVNVQHQEKSAGFAPNSNRLDFKSDIETYKTALI
jgi:hypothetical protein